MRANAFFCGCCQRLLLLLLLVPPHAFALGSVARVCCGCCLLVVVTLTTTLPAMLCVLPMRVQDSKLVLDMLLRLLLLTTTRCPQCC